MKLRSLIINIISILFVIPLYYIVGNNNIFLYTYSIYLYLILSSCFKHIDITPNIKKYCDKKYIYSLNTIYKYTNKSIIIINVLLSLIVLISSILLNKLFNIKGFVLVNTIMSLTLFIRPILKNIKSVCEVYNCKQILNNIFDIYNILNFIIKLCSVIICFKVLKLDSYKSISIIYLSSILSFILIYLLYNYLVLSIKIKKKQYKTREERINYMNEIKDILSRNINISIESIFKYSYFYISIIILYFILKNRYGYSYDKLSNVINNFYLYGISLVYIFVIIFKYLENDNINKLINNKNNILFDDYLINIFKKILSFIVIICMISGSIWMIIYGNNEGYILYMLSNLLVFYLFYDIIVSITISNISNKKLYIIFGIGLIIKLVFIVPLISSIYRMGFNLLYGDLFSGIISYIVVIILLIISNKNKYKINFAKKFDLILNAIYYNILLCIVLLLTSLIVSVKVVSRINAIKVILVYLFISYLYIFIRGRRDKNERIIIRNKK